MNPEPRPTLAYAPALDGLRAVAVLSVMLYHGGVSVFSGGFLGVDVFFVLSGYLITTLLLLEWEGSGRLDLPAFWGRRARRLLPALFLVLVAVLAFSWSLTGNAAATVRGDAVATLFYVSNWWYIFSGNSYFEQFQDPSPLTHTWSLAIEEQWYVILPLALVLLLPRLRGRRRLAMGFGALALLSALWMAVLHSPGNDPSRVYYGTDTRLHALLVGAFLACVFTPGAMQRLGRWGRWLAVGALAGAGAMFVVASDTSAWLYHGGFLVMAVLSAVLLASVIAAPRGPVARGLSTRPVVWVGRISYGLYLWHWPVYVFLSPSRTGMSGVGLLVLRLAVTFAVATASYYLVEMPIRRGGLSRASAGRRVGVLVGAPLLVLGMTAAGAATTRPPAPDSLESIRDAATRAPSPTPTPLAPTPQSPPPTEDVRALLLGDSVALSLFAAYETGSTSGLTVLPGTEFGCGLVPYAAALNGAEMPVRPECEVWERERAGRIAASGANLGVLFAGPWEQHDRWVDATLPYTSRAWREATVVDYQRALGELAAVTPRLAVVLNTCHGAPDLDLPDAVLFQAGRHPDVVNDPARVAAVNDAVREAVRRSGLDVTVIDPGPWLCKGGYRDRIDGVTMHTDGVHFTVEGARLYWGWLGPRLLKAGRTAVATPTAPAT
jgi:peptidoglycan/LPS O-acetylase OafA/YrhL